MLVSQIEELIYKCVFMDTITCSHTLMKELEYDTKLKEDFIRGLLKDENSFYYQILNKRLDYIDVKTYLGVEDDESIINLKLILFALFDLLKIDNPGRTVLYLIDVLSYIKNNNITKINLTTYLCILKDLYSDGFYTDETCTMIIDNYLKPQLVELSEIY